MALEPGLQPSITLGWNGAQPLPRRAAELRTSPSNIRNVIVQGVRTSMRLEPLMWSALKEVALLRKLTVNDLVTEIYESNVSGGLTSAVRVYLVGFYRDQLNTDKPSPAAGS